MVSNTAEQLSGSFKAESFWNGNPLAHSCGFMENVCSPHFPPIPLPMTTHILSGLREEHSLVSHHLAFHSYTNLPPLSVPRSFKTSKSYAKDQHLLPTFILTSGTSISKIVGTSSHLFSSNYLLNPVLVVTSSTAFFWSTMKVYKRLAKLR